MVIDSVSDEASLLLPLLENQYDDIVSSQFVLKFMYVYVGTQSLAECLDLSDIGRQQK